MTLFGLFLAIDHLLMARYLTSHQQRVSEMVEAFGLELEETPLLYVHDRVNLFALENHASVTLVISEIRLFEIIPTDDYIWEEDLFQDDEYAYEMFIIDESAEQNGFLSENESIESPLVENETFEELVLISERTFNHLHPEDEEVLAQEFELVSGDGNIFYTLTIATSITPVAHVINQVRELMLPAFVFGAIISAMIALFFAQYLARPVVKINLMAQKMSQLDLTGRSKVKRRDELGELAHNLNDMADKLARSMTDLTEANHKLKLEMNKEKEREKQRKDFFMAVSHELKTPLMILKMQLTGMIEKVGIYKNRDLYLTKSHATTDRMNDLIDKLLKITQLNEAEMKLSLERLDISRLVTNICHSYEELAMNKNISLTYFCEPELMSEFDKVQLDTTISNIVSNAIMHTKKGQIVNVQLRREADFGILVVENYGAKLSNEDLKHLFEPFYRVDKSRNRYTGGSGMGLYLIKTILELHKFDYELKNNEYGVVFTVQFPLQDI